MQNRATYFSLSLDTDSPALRRCSLEDHIRQSLRACILTRLGERSSYPTLGSRTAELLFRPLVNQVRAEIAQAIFDSVEKGEPRVEILNVEVFSDKLNPGMGQVQLKYRIRETSKVERLTVTLKP